LSWRVGVGKPSLLQDTLGRAEGMQICLLLALGCSVDENGWVSTGPDGHTGVPGVWVAGNLANPRARVITTAGEGCATAFAINADLVDEDVQAQPDRVDVACRVNAIPDLRASRRSVRRTHAAAGPQAPETLGQNVELRGFEPLTPSMRTRCATGLRHSPE
jgi:hypothetical protein